MKTGDRVRVAFIDRDIIKNKPVYKVIHKEGVIDKDFLFTICDGQTTTQNLYRVEMDDGSHENVWTKQLELI